MTNKLSAELLIKEHFALQDKLKEANKRFSEYCAPTKARLEEIDGQLLELLNSLSEGDKRSISCDSGTAYVSNLLNVSVDPEGEPYVNSDGESQVGHMALFDWAVEHWGVTTDGWNGSEMLLVQPQKDAVKAYIEAHGKAPPGLKISYFARVNVRRS